MLSRIMGTVAAKCNTAHIIKLPAPKKRKTYDDQQARLVFIPQEVLQQSVGKQSKHMCSCWIA